MPKPLVKNRTQDMGLQTPVRQKLLNTGPQAWEAAPALENVDVLQAGICPISVGTAATGPSAQYGIRFPFFAETINVAREHGNVEIGRDNYVVRAQSRCLSETFWINLSAFVLSPVAVKMFTQLRAAIFDVVKSYKDGPGLNGWSNVVSHMGGDIGKRIGELASKVPKFKVLADVAGLQGGSGSDTESCTRTTRVAAIRTLLSSFHSFLLASTFDGLNNDQQAKQLQRIHDLYGEFWDSILSTTKKWIEQNVNHEGLRELVSTTFKGWRTLNLEDKNFGDAAQKFVAALNGLDSIPGEKVVPFKRMLDLALDGLYVLELDKVEKEKKVHNYELRTQAIRMETEKYARNFPYFISSPDQDTTHYDAIEGGSSLSDKDARSAIFEFMSSEGYFGSKDTGSGGESAADMRKAIFDTLYNLYLRKVLVPYGAVRPDRHQTKDTDFGPHTIGVHKSVARSENTGDFDFVSDSLGMDAIAAVPPYVEFGKTTLERVSVQRDLHRPRWLVNLHVSPSTIRSTVCLDSGRFVTVNVPCAFKGLTRLRRSIFHDSVQSLEERVVRGSILKAFAAQVIAKWRSKLEDDLSFFNTGDREYVGDFERAFIEHVSYDENHVHTEAEYMPEFAELFFPHTVGRMRAIMRSFERFFPQVTHGAIRKLDPNSDDYYVRMYTSFIHP